VWERKKRNKYKPLTGEISITKRAPDARGDAPSAATPKQQRAG